jgi:hypothetical protein
MKRIEATVHTPHRAARARLPLALAGVLLASPVLGGQATPRASAVTPHWRSVVLVNANGTAYTEMMLLSARFHTMAPVTIVWNVASANVKGIRSRFAVALLDAQGRTRARLADTTRPGRASSTIDLQECFHGCNLRISIANMEYGVASYSFTLPQ